MMKIKNLILIFLLSPFIFFGQTITGNLVYDKSPNIYIPPSYSGLERQAEIASKRGIHNKEYCDKIEKIIKNLMPSVKDHELRNEFQNILNKLDAFKQDLYSQKTEEINQISQKLEFLVSALELENSVSEVNDLMLEKQWNKAIEKLKILPDNANYSDWKYSSLAMCYVKIADSYNAFNSLNKMNDKVLMRYQKAVIKAEMNDYYGSNEEYNQIITNNIFLEEFDKATVINNIAYNNVKLKKFDIALEQVNKALLINDSHSFIWDTKGEIMYNLGKYSECIEAMSKAINSDNLSANSFYFRGLSYLKIKEKEKACKDFSKSGELGNNEAYKLIKSNCN